MRDDLQRAIGRRVRELRTAAGLSQERLAEHAGLHRNYIGSIERGERDVGVGSLARIAAALRTSLADFFAPFGRHNPRGIQKSTSR